MYHNLFHCTYWMLSFCWWIPRDVCTSPRALFSHLHAIPASSFPPHDPSPLGAPFAPHAISLFFLVLRVPELDLLLNWVLKNKKKIRFISLQKVNVFFLEHQDHIEPKLPPWTYSLYLQIWKNTDKQKYDPIRFLSHSLRFIRTGWVRIQIFIKSAYRNDYKIRLIYLNGNGKAHQWVLTWEEISFDDWW